MAVTGTPTNRTSIDLPVDVSKEIIQKVQEESAIMKLARPIALPGRGTSINVITSDPTASWVGETSSKTVSDPGLETKVMQAYKLAVIVPFSNEFRRDVASLYEAIVARLPRALALKFDSTVFHGDAPGTYFDTFANCTAQGLGSDAYAGLVDAEADVADNGGIMNGIVLAPQGKSILLSSTDNNGRPLFINNVSEGAIPMVLGAKTYQSKAAYEAGSPNVIGVVGDWTQAMYGTVEGVKIDYSQDATLTSGDDTINLFQQNMFAVRAEIEIGFRADTSCFNLLTDGTTSA